MWNFFKKIGGGVWGGLKYAWRMLGVVGRNLQRAAGYIDKLLDVLSETGIPYVEIVDEVWEILKKVFKALDRGESDAAIYHLEQAQSRLMGLDAPSEEAAQLLKKSLAALERAKDKRCRR